MSCPDKIIVKPTSITEQKCIDNLVFWKEQMYDLSEDENVIRNKEISLNVLAAHTTRYDYLKNTFGYNEREKSFNPNCLGILSKRERSLIESNNEINLGVVDENMTTSLSLGHDIFVFAYHGIHNPYHRQTDPPPQQPIGYFIKKEIEVFGCVHGTPCDVAVKNDQVDPYREQNLDKFYLLPNDLREFKPLQIKNDSYFKNDFWFYFGSPDYWRDNEDYGCNLYKRQGEFRYLKLIQPQDIEAILWPIWPASITVMDKNWDLISAFKKAFPFIKIIEYNLKSHGDNWEMALVEASFYSQKYYLLNSSFHNSATFAKQKVIDYEQRT